VKTIVTGAGGFIGGHLVRRLLDSGHSVIAVDIKSHFDWYQLHPGALNMDDYDLRSKRDVNYALNVERVDRIYNLAADMGGMGFIENFKLDCMLSTQINTNMLLGIRKLQPHARYLFTSSACVYRADRQVDENAAPLREEDAYPAMPEDGYGWEKLFAERMCRHFMEDACIEVRIARLHNAYGPHGTYDGGREKAPAAICRKVIECQRGDRSYIEIWGDGRQTRSFMYIDDCVEGLVRLMEHPTHATPVNIGSAERVTINELVDIAEEVSGAGGYERRYDTTKPRGVNGRSSDNTLAREVFDGWEPRTPLREGMRNTFTWIKEQMNVVQGSVGVPGL
jgi:GDP-D-mannose 3', 5'-epimerase